MRSLSHLQKWIILSIGWWLFAGVVIYSLTFNSGDALHYLSIAWNMYKNHIYLSTYSGENLDLEKTPLFYWPIVAGWHIFGVSNFWPFILNYFIGWINLILVWLLARQFFPENPRIAWLSVWILMTSLYWPTFYGDIRFEGLETLLGLLFLNTLFKTLSSKKASTVIPTTSLSRLRERVGVRVLNVGYWLITSVVFGFCLFNKGPVALVYYLPLALILPYWNNFQIKRRRWYGLLTLTVLLSLTIPSLWLVAVYVRHGFEAVHYLLWGQVSRRVGILFSLDQFINLLKNFMPWTIVLLLLFLFRAEVREKLKEPKVIILFLLTLLELLFFSFAVKGQIAHYLIPVFPLVAITLSVLLHDSISDRAFFLIGGFFLITLALQILLWEYPKKKPSSLIPVAQQIKIIQQQGQAIAQFGTAAGYQNFGFLGRLDYELPIINKASQTDWLLQNPQGWVLKIFSNPPQCSADYWSWQLNKHRFLIIIRTQDFKSCKIVAG